jgi:hypothetical protein
LKPWSLSPPMSVTKPTLKPELLVDAPPDELVVLLDAAALAPPELLVLLLLLLLLPHAASPRATAMTRAARVVRLILPDTESPFVMTECATITRPADPWRLA